MNLLLINEHELNGDSVCISDDRANHILNIIKPSVGESLKAGIINGSVGVAEVVSISEESVTLRYTASGTPPKPVDMTLIIALPRPKVFRRILFGAVSCGVKDIHVINSWRVDKSYWESPYLSDENIQKISIDALSQAKDTTLPKVTFHRFFMDFIENELPLIPEERQRFIAHPYGERGCASAPCTVAVGPEGGFVQREVDTFIRHGFRCFSSGERTLTSEHFVPYLLGSIIK